jgi:hypothetical protein
MSADPTLVAALGQDGAWMFCAVKFELPGKTLRLLDGSGIVTIGAETYEGSDADFGVISAVDAIGEDGQDEAPEIRFTFFPADTAATVDLVNPAMQGSRVTIMVGVANPATMVAVGTPEVIFLGEVDVATLRLDQGMREIEFTVVSVFERLFAVDEGERATDAAHQAIYAGELGLDQMTGTTEKLYWGTHAPIVTYGGGGSGARARSEGVRNAQR